MKLLFLSYNYEPDLGAGSFRNTNLAEYLAQNYKELEIDVCTTSPSRYDSFKENYIPNEKRENLRIVRFSVIRSSSNLLFQICSFFLFALKVIIFIRKNKYDAVYASSSRLMTAVLGAFIANKKKSVLYIDLRDLFLDVLKNSNYVLYFLLFPILQSFESFVFKKAKKINLVSEGFKDYLEYKFPKSKFVFFSNGIDDIFVENSKKTKKTKKTNCLKKSEKIKVLYAGNIGYGQALDKILPQMAHKLKKTHDFYVIGDGSEKNLLLSSLKKLDIENVFVRNPVKREDLVKKYYEADILFLHLNNTKAFEKVLPSKIFEYASMNKPILAGVAGFSKKFIQNEIVDAEIFHPLDVSNACKSLMSIDLKKNIDREDFIKKFARSKITAKLAFDVHSTIIN